MSKWIAGQARKDEGSAFFTVASDLIKTLKKPLL